MTMWTDKPDVISLIGLRDSKDIGLNKFMAVYIYFFNKIGELKDFPFSLLCCVFKVL